MQNNNSKTPATSLLAPKTKLLLAALCVLCGGFTVLPISSVGIPLIAIGAPSLALLLRDKAEPLYLVLPLLSYGIGVAVCGFTEFLMPVETLSVFLGGLLLGVALRERTKRTTQVLLTALGIVLPFAVVYGVQFLQANGFVDLATLKEMIGETRTELVRVCNEAVEAALEGVPEADKALYVSLFNTETVTQAVDVILIITPALVIDGVLILSYLVTTLYVTVVRLCHAETLLPDAPYMLTMSAPAAILYVASFLLATIFTLGNTVAAVAINLLLLLLPGFALVAGKRFLWRRRNGLLGRWGRTAFFLVIMLLFINPFGALMLMGLAGAYEEIERLFRRQRKK